MILLAEALSLLFALNHNINPKIIKLILLTEALSVSFGLSLTAVMLCSAITNYSVNINPRIIKSILLIEALSVSLGLPLTPTSKNN